MKQGKYMKRKPNKSYTTFKLEKKSNQDKSKEELRTNSPTMDNIELNRFLIQLVELLRKNKGVKH